MEKTIKNPKVMDVFFARMTELTLEGFRPDKMKIEMSFECAIRLIEELWSLGYTLRKRGKIWSFNETHPSSRFKFRVNMMLPAWSFWIKGKK